jgi:hypothetical protein
MQNAEKALESLRRIFRTFRATSVSIGVVEITNRRYEVDRAQSTPHLDAAFGQIEGGHRVGSPKNSVLRFAERQPPLFTAELKIVDEAVCALLPAFGNSHLGANAQVIPGQPDGHPARRAPVAAQAIQ